MNRRISAVKVASLGILLVFHAEATDYYVSPSGSNEAPYTNWTMAATAPQSAINQASSDDSVYVAAGTYVLSSPLILTNGASVFGVDGSSNTVLQAAQFRRCIKLGGTSLLSGFTLKNGDARYETGLKYGGGAYMDGGGTLEDCIVQSCTASAGGGIYCHNGGLVDRCMVTGNNVSWTGAGIYCNGGGEIRNSLIVLNTSSDSGGGISSFDGGPVNNCTIACNTANMIGGLNYQQFANPSAGRLSNLIVYENSASSDPDMYIYASWSTVSHLCSPINSYDFGITDPPLFVDANGGDFRLQPASPCRDAGLDWPWMTGTTDLDDVPRILGPAPDMGAYEFDSRPLSCGFSGSPTTGFPPLVSVFTASVSGTNTSGLVYRWDLNGDDVWDYQGSDAGTVTNTYSVAGSFRVRLRVENEGGESAEQNVADYIEVWPRNVYVATNGAHVSPFTSWADAATNLQDAVDVAVDTTMISVAAGTYLTDAQIVLDKAVLLKGISGAQSTILQPRTIYSHRLLSIANEGAVVEGFTLNQGGQSSTDGGALSFSANGLVRRCIIQYSQALRGGGANLSSTGRLEETELFGCQAGQGGAIRMGGAAAVRRCTIHHCTAFQTMSFDNGGGVYMDDGLLENCLVYSNQAYSAGAGIYLINGQVQNCTITANRSTGTGGPVPAGLYARNTGTVRNTIIAGNEDDDIAFDPAASTVFEFCCSPETLAGSGNITNAPGWIDSSRGPCRLGTASPCIDSGTETGAPDVDLDGLPRPIDGDGNLSAQTDIGACEYAEVYLDSDNDRLSDYFEVFIFGSDPLLKDTDGDGADDFAEFVADTDPTDATDLFRVQVDPVSSGSSFVLSWHSATGRFYSVLSTEDLSAQAVAVPGAANLPGTGALMSYSNATDSASQFFKIKVEMP